MELRVGNKYRLGRKIGSGSFGDIYLGESWLAVLVHAWLPTIVRREQVDNCVLVVGVVAVSIFSSGDMLSIMFKCLLAYSIYHRLT